MNRGLSPDPLDADPELAGLVDNVLGDARTGRGDQTLRHGLEHLVVALEGGGLDLGVDRYDVKDKAVSLDALRAEKMKNIASLAEENLEAALQTLVEARLNVLISGGTSTGKTTFARHLLTHVTEDERLITIEDAFELFPGQPNTVALLADRGSGSQRSANALLQASLRMRPDRIIVGELRGAEALTYLEAINTGHGGSVSTIHAETAELAIDRLAIMVLQAGTPLTFAVLPPPRLNTDRHALWACAAAFVASEAQRFVIQLR